MKSSGSAKTLDEMEKQMILSTIEECRGNLSRTAEKLGIGRATLYRKMEKHGIQTGKNE
jgi:transcriptional regulator of acetoin/glycerol metabolism